MAGHGRLMTRKPPRPGSTSRPVSSTIAASMPGRGSVHEPGFNGVAPGSGVIMCTPVSVYHHVTTTGQRSRLTFVKYHIHTSVSMDSPTDLIMHRQLRLNMCEC